jgi:hypothetical protein
MEGRSAPLLGVKSQEATVVSNDADGCGKAQTSAYIWAFCGKERREDFFA